MTEEAMLLAQHMTKGGVVSSYKSSAVISDELDRETLRRAIKDAVLDFKAKEKQSAESREKADREVSKRSALEARMITLEENIERLGSHVENQLRVRQLQKDFASLKVQHTEQQQLADREVQLMNQACKEADYAEMALDRFGDSQGLLEEMLQEARREDAAVAKYRVKKERETALRFESQRRKKEADVKLQRNIQEELAETQIDATKAEHATALRRRKDALRHRDTALTGIMSIQSAEHQKRTQAVLGLKKSTERVTNVMRGNVARNKQAEAERKAQEKKEFNALLADGKNPYEVFRKRAQQYKLKADQARLVNRQRKTEIEIAAKMIQEENHFVKKDKVEKKQKQFAAQYRDSLGRHVTEQRTRNYMLNITKESKDFVDPTGRMFRIEGNEHTALKDRSFGLGKIAKERPDIIKKEAARPGMRGVQFSERHAYVKGARAMGVTSMDAIDRDGTKKDGLDAFSDLLGDVDMPGENLIINEEEGQQINAGGANGGVPAPSASANVRAAPSSVGGGANNNNSAEEARGVANLPDEPTVGVGSGSQRKLTKLEQTYMKQALERQRGNIVQKQVVWGKEFKGQAFISKPERIVFKDFEVGKKMKRRFTLTNTSFSFNHFKLLSLPDEIKDFFELTYTKPGRMSAGMTCSIVVEFEPKLNQDIFSSIPLLAQTGPFEIPLICTTKKIVPSINVKVLPMGTVVLGEQITGKIRITNDGALPTRYKIQQPIGIPIADEFEFDAETDELVNQAPLPGIAQDDVLTYKVEGDVAPYSSVDVVLEFCPRQPGTLSRVLEFEFDGSDVIERCDVEATALRIPIYVEKRMIDLKCCVASKLYRAAINVRNRGTIALKMNFNMAEEFIGTEELSFSPPMCYIQGRDSSTGDPGSFDVQMKFRPSEKTLARMTEAYVRPEENNNDDTIVVVPMTIDVSGQVLDVIFRMRAKLTTSDVVFDPPSVDFGPCFTDRTVSYPIKIQNMSALPQKFGFVKLPREISVPYQDGFGTLLPYETIERELLFSPVSATDHNFNLTFSTYMNRTFSIQCRGRGVRPPLEFTITKIQLQCTPNEEIVEKSLFVKNVSKFEQMYEFGTPALELSGLTISPKCAVLSPGTTQRVEVVYDPSQVGENTTKKYPADDDEEYEAKKVEAEEEEERKRVEEEAATNAARSEEEESNDDDKKGNKKGGKIAKEIGGGSDEGDIVEAENAVTAVPEVPIPSPEGAVFQQSNRLGDEPGSLHAKWIVPCFIKETNDRAVPRSPRSARAASMSQPVQTLEICTTTLSQKKLECLVPPDTLSKLTRSTASRLDFGQMAVGQEEIAPLKLANIHSGPVVLRLKQGPNVQGPFSIVNALRPLSGYGDVSGEATSDSMTVYVRFKPEDQLTYCERITFETEFGQASIVLVGQGVSPTLELTPSVRPIYFRYFISFFLFLFSILLLSRSLSRLFSMSIATSRIDY